MKRFITVLTAILLIFSISITASAADYYYIEGLDAFMEIPSDLLVFTRDEYPSDETFEAYGFSHEDFIYLMESMVSSDVYLRALDVSGLAEHILIKEPLPDDSRVKDFNSLSDAELEDIVTNVLAVDGLSNGIYYDQYDIYRHPQVTFVALTFTTEADDEIIYGLEYYTVKDSEIISFTLRSYGNPISDTQSARHREMVESLTFYGTDMSLDVEPVIIEEEKSPLIFDTSSDGSAAPFAILILVIIVFAASSKAKKKGKSKTPAVKINDSVKTTVKPKPAETVKSAPETQDYSQTDYRKPVAYCSQCGARVYSGEMKCHICGTRVRKRRSDFDLYK